MSDDILKAAEQGREYLQSPVDDLYSFYYTMQFAAVFHDKQFTEKEDTPSQLKTLRGYLWGDRFRRVSATFEICFSFLSPFEYGSVLVECQPMLQDWFSALQDLKNEWKKQQFMLPELKTAEAREIYIPLFLKFALKGVVTLAELVKKHKGIPGDAMVGSEGEGDDGDDASEERPGMERESRKRGLSTVSTPSREGSPTKKGRRLDS